MVHRPAVANHVERSAQSACASMARPRLEDGYRAISCLQEKPARHNWDIFQSGVLGLIRAAQKYRRGGKAQFATYAWYWIANQMQRLIAREMLIHIPMHIACVTKKTAKNINPKNLEAASLAMCPLPIDGADIPGDTCLRIEDDEERAKLRNEVSRLPIQYRSVIQQRFGLDGYVPASLETIASRIGLSKQRVHQIEQRAIEMLREKMEAA